MRWLLPLIVMAGPVSVEAQENKGEKLYRDFEKKLKSAKAYRVTFETKCPERHMFLKGSLLIAGNKLKGIAEGQPDVYFLPKDAEMTFLSDGKVQARTFTSLGKEGVKGKPTRTSWEASPKLGTTVTGLLARQGVYSLLTTFGPLVNSKLSTLHLEGLLDSVEVKNFNLVGTEKLGDKVAQVVEFNLELKEKMEFPEFPKISSKIWFDTVTKLPVKRIQEQSDGGKVIYRRVDTYSRWEIDPEIKEGTFTLRKEQTNNE
jgi:hypothetical protein